MRTAFKMILSLALILALSGPALAVRIKDLAHVHGVRSNQLVGYGLIIGLNGTGDKSSSTFTVQSLSNLLTRMGIRVTQDQLKVKNVAAVMVTTELPPFARTGNRLDVNISSLGDATSLAGGTLLITPLKAVDGNTYAMAQGPVSVGGFSAGGEAAGVTKNHPTAGRIPQGALVEREVPYEFGQQNEMTFNLRKPDFTTAVRMAESINQAMPALNARAIDSGTIKLNVPTVEQGGDPVGTMARLENLEVLPDNVAKVVVDERTGTVVMGEQVRINTVAVASGSLTISVTETPQASQPLPLSQGQTVVLPRTEVEVIEGKGHLAILKPGPMISDVVKALNALGSTPRDLIVILQAIKAAGALQAELEII